jgi:hypothetical protein
MTDREKVKAIENYEKALLNLLAHVHGVTVGHNLTVLQSRLYEADIEIIRHDLRDTTAYRDAVLRPDRRACESARTPPHRSVGKDRW